MESESSWLTSSQKIDAKLREIAYSMLSYTAALNVSAQYRSLVGNLDIMPSACHDKSPEELAALIVERATLESAHIAKIMDTDTIAAKVKIAAQTLQQSLDNGTDDWKCEIPGKQLLSKFSSQANINVGRLKQLYLREAENHAPYPFAEIVAIFQMLSEF